MARTGHHKPVIRLPLIIEKQHIYWLVKKISDVLQDEKV